MLSRRERLLLAALFVLSLPAVTPRLYSSDEVQYFSYLRSLWFDHDVSFENEYQYFYDHQIARTPDFHTTFLELETAAHRRINYGTIGCAILWSPFYAVGDVANSYRPFYGGHLRTEHWANALHGGPIAARAMTTASVTTEYCCRCDRVRSRWCWAP